MLLFTFISFINPAGIPGLSGFELALIITVFAVLLILTCIMVVLLLSDKRKLKYNIKLLFHKRACNRNNLKIFNLRDNLEKTVSNISEIGAGLEDFKLDIEDYAANCLKREESLKEKYKRIIDNIILLLNHFEIYERRKGRPGKIKWFHEKTRWILEQEGIKEIPVNKGDLYNGIYHQQVKSCPNKLPDGTVLKVLSRGYYKKGKTDDDDTIFKPAGVIVSSGLRKKHISKRGKK